MISRDQVLSIGSFPAVFDMYEQASEQGRAGALSELLATIVQFGIAKNCDAKVLQLMSTFTPAWAATAWMSFVKSGAMLVKPEHHRRAAQAFLTCNPHEAQAVKTLEWLLCKQDQPDAQAFSPSEQKAMLERLVILHQWPALLSLLNTYRAPLICSLLFSNGDMALWDELRNGEEVRFVGRALARWRAGSDILPRNSSTTISLLVEHCITNRENNLHAVQELMLGLCEGLHDDQGDWDKLLDSAEVLLDPEGVMEVGLTLASCLGRLDLFSYQRKMRLFRLCASWPPVQNLRYMSRLIRGAKGHVGPLAWARVIPAAKACAFDDVSLVEDLARGIAVEIRSNRTAITNETRMAFSLLRNPLLTWDGAFMPS